MTTASDAQLLLGTAQSAGADAQLELVDYGIEVGVLARSSAASPLGRVATLAARGAVGRSASLSPLGETAVLAAVNQLLAWSTASSPLGVAAALADHLVVAHAVAATMLGVPAVVESDTTIPARVLVRTILGAPAAMAGPVVAGCAAVESPLGVPAVLVPTILFAVIEVEGPLMRRTWWDGWESTLAAFVRLDPMAAMDTSGPLGPEMIWVRQPVRCAASAPSPLSVAYASWAFNDFSQGLPAGWPTFYTCDLTMGGVATRLRISSWQATMQTGSACFVQAVVPAVTSEQIALFTSAVAAGTAILSIHRLARLRSGSQLEVELAAATLDQARYDRGPTNATATLSGYAGALTGTHADYLTRTLRDVRSISAGKNDRRARAAIDWFLRPGQSAIFPDGSSLEADYVNYYVNASDSYMEVGERA